MNPLSALFFLSIDNYLLVNIILSYCHVYSFKHLPSCLTAAPQLIMLLAAGEMMQFAVADVAKLRPDLAPATADGSTGQLRPAVPVLPKDTVPAMQQAAATSGAVPRLCTARLLQGRLLHQSQRHGMCSGEKPSSLLLWTNLYSDTQSLEILYVRNLIFTIYKLSLMQRFVVKIELSEKIIWQLLCFVLNCSSRLYTKF